MPCARAVVDPQPWVGRAVRGYGLAACLLLGAAGASGIVSALAGSPSRGSKPARAAEAAPRSRPLAEARHAEPRAQVNWVLHCAGCHGLDGDAPVPSVPVIKDYAGYFAHDERGREYLVRAPGPAMSLLSDRDLADVMNWMLYSLSAKELPRGFRPYSAQEIRRLRERPLTLDAEPTRNEILRRLQRAGVVPLADERP